MLCMCLQRESTGIPLLVLWEPYSGWLETEISLEILCNLVQFHGQDIVRGASWWGALLIFGIDGFHGVQQFWGRNDKASWLRHHGCADDLMVNCLQGAFRAQVFLCWFLESHTVDDWKQRSVLKSCAISWTRPSSWWGALLISGSDGFYGVQQFWGGNDEASWYHKCMLMI